MDLPCDDGFSRQGEFVFLDECIIPLLVVQIIDVITLLGAVGLFISMIVLVIKFHANRPHINRFLIGWAMVQQLLMAVRPAFNLLGLYSTTLWVSFIVHGTAAMMASVPIFFMYIELKIILRGSLKTRARSLKSTQWTLGLMGALEVILFMGLPAIFWHFNIPANIAFWIPVIVVDFTAIPYFCYLGISIYLKIKNLHDDQHTRVSRRILISVIICSILGLFTGSAGIIATIIPEVDWVLVRSCWLAGMGFSQVIFISLVGRPGESSKLSRDVSNPSASKSKA